MALWERAMMDDERATNLMFGVFQVSKAIEIVFQIITWSSHKVQLGFTWIACTVYRGSY